VDSDDERQRWTEQRGSAQKNALYIKITPHTSPNFHPSSLLIAFACTPNIQFFFVRSLEVFHGFFFDDDEESEKVIGEKVVSSTSGGGR
jgi:hypothetical protein